MRIPVGVELMARRVTPIEFRVLRLHTVDAPQSEPVTLLRRTTLALQLPECS